MNFPKLYECDPQKNTECNKRNCGNPCRYTTRKEFSREPSEKMTPELLAVLIVTAVVFIKSRGYALAWRGYEAVGGEFMLLLIPIIYYEAKRIILDYVADFVALYRRSRD